MIRQVGVGLMLAGALAAGAGTLGVDDFGRVSLTADGVTWTSEKPAMETRVVSSAKDRLSIDVSTPEGLVRAEWKADGENVTLKLSAPANRPMKGVLAYPPAWETRSGDVGVHPIGEGEAYGVDDPEAPFRAKPGCNVVLPFCMGHKVSMGFFGLRRDETYLMTGVKDALYAQYVITSNMPRRAGIEWQPEEGQWGTDRELRFFVGKTLGTVAGAYRAWRDGIRPVRTLAEYAKLNPNVLLLPGAADFWVWDDNAQNRLYNWPIVKESAPRDVKKIADEMKSLGLDRVLWNGFDNETPEDCAYLKKIGYLCGTYDCFRDVYHKGLLAFSDPKNFARGARFMPFAEEVARIEEDGSIATAWTIPDRMGKMHAMYALCDSCAPELVKKLIEPDVKRIGYTARLMDVQAADGPGVCHSPTHPSTRRRSLEAMRKEHRYLTDDLSQIVGVEVGGECMVGCYAYAEGLPSKNYPMHPICWRMKDRALYGKDVPKGLVETQMRRKYRIPLWELVYHDCCVNYYYWGDTTLMYPVLSHLKDLWCALYGLPPIYSMNVRTWNELKNDVAASYRRATPVARATMFARMTEFEFLDPEGHRQRSTFSNGVRVTVDFDKMDCTTEGIDR